MVLSRSKTVSPEEALLGKACTSRQFPGNLISSFDEHFTGFEAGFILSCPSLTSFSKNPWPFELDTADAPQRTDGIPQAAYPDCKTGTCAT
jgi:hypothetical protein